MFTNEDILRISMEQSALDLGCAPADFLRSEPVILEGTVGPGAKRYYEAPVNMNLVSYGNNVVGCAQSDILDVAREYVGKFEFFHCFETPNIHWLDGKLEKHGLKVCFMAEYYLPDVNRSVKRECRYELRELHKEDFASLYLPQWSNALCEKRKELDTLGVGAYDKGELVGFAACSADADEMWQIGVDVLPEYRRQGIGAAVTAKLRELILERGKVPFYCTAWSNMRSARNAITCGFLPAWAEMTVKPAEIVDQMNV